MKEYLSLFLTIIKRRKTKKIKGISDQECEISSNELYEKKDKHINHVNCPIHLYSKTNRNPMKMKFTIFDDITNDNFVNKLINAMQTGYPIGQIAKSPFISLFLNENPFSCQLVKIVADWSKYAIESGVKY